MFQIPARCIRDEQTIDEALEIPWTEPNKDGKHDHHFVNVQIWQQYVNSEDTSVSVWTGTKHDLTITSAQNDHAIPILESSSVDTPTDTNHSRLSGPLALKKQHEILQQQQQQQSQTAVSGVDVVRTIDGWMRELQSWKLWDLFDVASRLHVGGTSTASDSKRCNTENAFELARRVLSGVVAAPTIDDDEMNTDEVLKVRACRDQLINIIVQARHRHLTR